MSKHVKIGPDLPAGLGITNVNEPEKSVEPSAPSAPVGVYEVSTTDIHGNTVTTIMGVAVPKVETAEERQARVVSEYTDGHGNTVTTY